MTQTHVLLLLLGAYLCFLVVAALLFSRSSAVHAHREAGSQGYLFGTGFGFWLSFFGIAASLFSTFTLEGMPSFFKTHGIASWVFLGVTDVCLAALLLYCGLKVRALARALCVQKPDAPSINNITEWLKSSGLPRWVVWFFVIAVTVFMVPYITIQIKGSAVLMQSAIPLGDTQLLWSIIAVAIMLSYSWFGGIRAIFVTDMVQGVVLLVTVWAVAYFAIQASGGIAPLFAEVQRIEPALLSAPGPKGLLHWQFLLIGFISIVVMPYVQPQMATRMFVARDDRTFVRSTVALAIFAVLVILPTLFIGLRSAVISYTAPEGHFLLQLLRSDAPVIIYALFIVGVLAAAMSTADSQLMAIGTEWRSAMSKRHIVEQQQSALWVKAISAVVAIVALMLAQSSFSSLVLFAINSFIGTSLLLPIIVAAAVNIRCYRLALIAVSVIALGMFTLALLGVVPKNLVGIRLELLLYAAVGVTIAFALRAGNTDNK